MSISTYTAIVIGSMLKFILGPAIGGKENVPFYITGMLTALGMMLSVVIFSFLGEKLRAYLRKRRIRRNKKIKIKKKHRQMIRIWNSYGMFGVAFFTPLILTPIGGTLLAVSLGAPHKKIFLYMSISAVFWGNVLSFILLKFEQEMLHLLNL